MKDEKMNCTIRKPNWDDLNERGIPKDNADVMDFFNYALKMGAYPYVCRNSKITEDEIKNIWIPTKDKNITYVAHSPGMNLVVGSGTLLVKDDIGEYNLAVDLDFHNIGIGTAITKKVIDEALSKNITVSIHTSVDNIGMQKIMEHLEHKPEKIENFSGYVGKIKGSYDAYRYLIKK